MSSNGVIGNCLTEIVAEKVIRDKYKHLLEKQGGEKPKARERPAEEKKKDDFDLSDEDLMDDEAEKIMQRMKAEKMQEVKKFESKQKETFDVGDYREIVEDEFLNYVTKNVYSLVHFYHNDFERCKIIDKHLRLIAETHGECRFLCLNAEKAPFFIQKLAIRTLPTIVCFIDGVARDRVVGFEDLGGKDEFDTIVLTRRLVKAGVIKAKTEDEKGFRLNKAGKGRRDNDSGSSDDD